ncbi:unnamed protein product [Closterium sp. NIES-65]|nr:unnamed protein product [Closterium sp. NIES-65]
MSHQAQMLEVGSVGMAGAGGNGTQEDVTLFMHYEKPMVRAAAMAKAVREAAAFFCLISHASHSAVHALPLLIPQPTGAAAMAKAVREAAASIQRNPQVEGEGETASAAEAEEGQESAGVRVEEASEETPGFPPSSLLAMSAEVSETVIEWSPALLLARYGTEWFEETGNKEEGQESAGVRVEEASEETPGFPPSSLLAMSAEASLPFISPTSTDTSPTPAPTVTSTPSPPSQPTFSPIPPPPLPPLSHTVASLPQHPGLAALHLSDFNQQVSNPYLNSHLDTLPTTIHPPPFPPSLPHAGLSALHLSDFNQHISNPYLNSHLDTLPSVHLLSLTLSSTLLARSLLLLSGAPPSLALRASVNASLISNLVLCLLSPSPGLLCPLASSLLTPRDPAPSHYAGVFLGVPPSISPSSSSPPSSAASSPPLDTLADTPRYIPALSPRLVFNNTHWSIVPPRPGSHGDLVDPVWTESFWQHLKLRSYLVDDPIWDASILFGGVVWVVVLCVLVTWADKAVTQKLKRV